ncbi:glycosyltransferase family 2 protein [Patescibacteria group bacterium]|nr:glycosyltransferase family 2 protein [Patescibacteria group bacterium]
MKQLPATHKFPPLLSIIFPNWNGAQDTLAYLQSIRKSSYPQKEIEIIMVDNHSRDSSVKYVRKLFPEVKIIELDQNYGPAYARNRGIEQAQGEIIFCSDNDQILATNTLEILANLLQVETNKLQTGANKLQIKTDKPQIGKGIGIVGAKVLTKSEPHRIVSCGYKFNRWLGLESGSKDCQQIKECDWVAGCSMMFGKSLIDEIGIFDENFFFYAEDADFCLRAKKAGFKVVSLPNAIVYHGKNDQSPALLTDEGYLDYYKAKFRLIKKHCNLLQQIISLGLHLTVFSWIRYLTGKKESLLLKFKALTSTLKTNAN